MLFAAAQLRSLRYKDRQLPLLNVAFGFQIILIFCTLCDPCYLTLLSSSYSLPAITVGSLLGQLLQVLYLAMRAPSIIRIG